MIGLLLAALMGPPSPAELGVQILKPEPQDVQLKHGADPGSFHFVRNDDLKITFSMKPDFPVRLVAEDYAHHEITSKLITSPAPFGFEIDLPPGTYTCRTKVHEKSDAPYEDSEGFQVHIDKTGKLHYLVPPEYTNEFRHRHKIEITSPKDFTTIHGKIFQLGDDPADKRMSLHDIVLHWKPLPGIKSYVVTLGYMGNAFHANSCGADPERWAASGSSFRFPKDANLSLEESASVWVAAGDLDGEFGDAGDGGIVIMTPDAEKTAEAKRNHFFDGDDWVDTRSGICFEQVPGVVDSMPYVRIAGLGNGPALDAGVAPNEHLSTIDGTPVGSLGQVKQAIEKIASGGQVILGISYPAPRRFTLRLR